MCVWGGGGVCPSYLPLSSPCLPPPLTPHPPPPPLQVPIVGIITRPDLTIQRSSVVMYQKLQQQVLQGQAGAVPEAGGACYVSELGAGDGTEMYVSSEGAPPPSAVTPGAGAPGDADARPSAACSGVGDAVAGPARQLAAAIRQMKTKSWGEGLQRLRRRLLHSAKPSVLDYEALEREVMQQHPMVGRAGAVADLPRATPSQQEGDRLRNYRGLHSVMQLQKYRGLTPVAMQPASQQQTVEGLAEGGRGEGVRGGAGGGGEAEWGGQQEGGMQEP